jgi:hypothetical protein
MPYETHIANDLDDCAKLLSVHDQQVSEVREDYAQWAITQTEPMEKAYVMQPSGAFKSRIRHHGPLPSD